MTEEKTGDDRSMSEILASIRKIVTDEEQTRRAAERQRGEDEGEGAAPVLELTDAMRAQPVTDAAPEGGPDSCAPSPDPEYNTDSGAEPDDAAPLDLGREAVRVFAPASAPVERSSRPDRDDIEAIVRRVVREELRGTVGLEISRKVKASIHEELRRALADDEPLI